MIFVYGSRGSHLQTSTPQATCLTCHTTGPHTLSTFGRYAHLYWIPLFPLGKTSVSDCHHCRVTHNEKTMPTQLRQLAGAQDQQARTPFWHWSGLGTFGAVVLAVSVLNLFSPRKSKADNTEPVAAISPDNNLSDEEVDQAYQNEKEQRTDQAEKRAAPNTRRAAMVAEPQPGDVYTLVTQPGGTYHTVMTILAVTDKGIRCKVRTVVPTELDSSVVEQAITYPKIALVSMEKNGAIEHINRP